MFEKILVPLDGSQLAEVALSYAEELSGRLGSKVTLIYVNELINDTHQNMSQLYMQKMIDSTKQAAETYSGKLGKIQVKSDILFGNPAEEIIKCADKEDISLIIMSTHGQSGIRRWTLGSVANKVDFCSTEEVAALQGTAMVNSIREGKS